MTDASHRHACQLNLRAISYAVSFRKVSGQNIAAAQETHLTADEENTDHQNQKGNSHHQSHPKLSPREFFALRHIAAALRNRQGCFSPKPGRATKGTRSGRLPANIAGRRLDAIVPRRRAGFPPPDHPTDKVFRSLDGLETTRGMEVSPRIIVIE